MSGAPLAAPWRRWLADCGFAPPLLVFALRTALAAFAALAIAYALGLEHPHWAAMSAWASSQPTREHLLSRSLYRFGGSVVGVAYAVLLVLVAQDSLWVLALGLTLWGTACTFLGNLQRGYLVYGCMLAGYSAAMVVLLHQGPAGTIWAFGGDRMLTVLTGVACALCISWWFSPRRDAPVLIRQSRRALALVLQAAAAQLRGRPAPDGLDDVELLTTLARVEALLELYPEGSRTARRTTRAIHRQQHRALELIYRLSQAQLDAADVGMSAPSQGHPQPALADALDALCRRLREPVSARTQEADALVAALQDAVARCEAAALAEQPAALTAPTVLNALLLLLQDMRHALHAEQVDCSAQTGAAPPAALGVAPAAAPLPLHRDWVGARQAAIRAGGSLLVFGVLWALTGWGLVAFGMLGLSVMLLVFSGFENPQRTVAYVLRGQFIGAALALACLGLAWPLAPSGWAMVAMLLPFALLAALVFAHPRTAAGGMDTNMAMFILLAPVFPYTVDMGKSVGMALALVSGPALAWLAYRYVYPTNAQHRMRTLAQMMLAEVPALAQRLLREGVARTPDGLWQARLHHRVLRLMRWADRNDHAQRQHLAQTGQALRFMQSSMLALQQWRHDAVLATPGIRRAARQADLALRRTVQWGQSGPRSAAGAKAPQAWLALSAHEALPPALAAQARRVALRCLPVLDDARHHLKTQ